MANALVGIILGSASDRPTMEACTKELDKLGVGYDSIVASAHRAPDKVAAWAAGAEGRGIEVIIAAAGKAAALPGVVAAHTVLPVIGVPILTKDLGGLDSLLSIVQMPPGVPVATVGIDAARNAALLAAQVVATGHPEVRETLRGMKEEMARA